MPGPSSSRAATAVPAAAATDRWLTAALELDRWMSAQGYGGWDPHDLLGSSAVRALSLGSRWLMAAWTQVGKRSPIQLRGLLRVPRVRNAKGMGLVLAAKARHPQLHGSGESPDEIVEWLDEHAATGYAGPGWGYPFPWANRDFYAPAGTPSSVATAFVAHALLDADERLGIARAGELGEAAAEFVRRDLNRIPGAAGTFCFSYTPLDGRAVHNASLLAASLLARVAARRDDAGMRDDALAAVGFTLAAQRADGSWPYGVGARNAWVDSFHTSYNLVALAGIRVWLGAGGLEGPIARGTVYWRDHFFGGPAVGFFPDRPYPIDIHAVAHAILALLTLEDEIPEARAEAERLGDWCLREMRDPAGFFYYSRTRRGTNRLPYMRWVQSWMLRALAELASSSAAPGAGREISEGS